MDKQQTIECGFCTEGIATYQIEPTLFTKDDVNYTLDRHYYECKMCKEKFTTDIQDLRTLAQIPGSIWEKELQELESKNKLS